MYGVHFLTLRNWVKAPFVHTRTKFRSNFLCTFLYLAKCIVKLHHFPISLFFEIFHFFRGIKSCTYHKYIKFKYIRNLTRIYLNLESNSKNFISYFCNKKMLIYEILQLILYQCKNTLLNKYYSTVKSPGTQSYKEVSTYGEKL